MATVDAHPLVQELATRISPNDASAAESLKTLADTPDLPELVIFAGYAGPPVERPVVKTEWQLFYLDPQLFRWMLVEGAAIRHHVKVDDRKLPDGGCNYIWLATDARVGHGRGAQTVERRFLTGEFTRAGDFEVPPRGGTYSGTTGAFCEARTPMCCRRMSQR